MFIVLCTFLAVSPVQPSLLPQTSAVRLLDESTELSQDDSERDDGNRAPWGARLAVEAVAGALLGGGLGAAGVFLGGSGLSPSGGFTSISFTSVLLGFIGLEIGEVAGIALAGSALGWHGTVGQVVFGKAITITAMLLLSPLVGLWVWLAGPVVAITTVCLISLAAGIVGGEILGTDRARPQPSETPAALTLRF